MWLVLGQVGSGFGVGNIEANESCGLLMGGIVLHYIGKRKAKGCDSFTTDFTSTMEVCSCFTFIPSLTLLNLMPSTSQAHTSQRVLIFVSGNNVCFNLYKRANFKNFGSILYIFINYAYLSIVIPPYPK